MIKISNLVEELKKFPQDALVYAYEGESTCIVIVDSNHKELGHIPAYDSTIDDVGKTVIENSPR